MVVPELTLSSTAKKRVDHVRGYVGERAPADCSRPGTRAISRPVDVVPPSVRSCEFGEVGQLDRHLLVRVRDPPQTRRDRDDGGRDQQCAGTDDERPSGTTQLSFATQWCRHCTDAPTVAMVAARCPTVLTMTMPHRPFRFGVQVNGSGTRSEWVEQARRVETLGYSTMTMPDHFTDQLAPVPALQCAADATSTLRLGALVYDNDYKHPVVLAKELATMDVLSSGRVEIGLGAGLDGVRLRAVRHRLRPAGGPRQPLHRGAPRDQVGARPRPVLLRGRALHDHRLRRPSQTGPVAAAGADRRRRDRAC